MFNLRKYQHVHSVLLRLFCSNGNGSATEHTYTNIQIVSILVSSVVEPRSYNWKKLRDYILYLG